MVGENHIEKSNPSNKVLLHDSRNGSRSNFIAGVLRLEVPRVRVVFGVSGRLLCLPTMETVGCTNMLKT